MRSHLCVLLLHLTTVSPVALPFQTTLVATRRCATLLSHRFSTAEDIRDDIDSSFPRLLVVSLQQLLDQKPAQPALPVLNHASTE